MPRFRIYTRASDYVYLLRDLLLGRATRGADNERLERAISERCQVGHAACVPQARVGIYLAVKHLIKPGQKVVLSPYTIADVINMVICAGGIPVFADIDRSTTNIRAEEIDRLIDDQTGAVMVTHLHGMACEIEKIAAICRARNVPLIEDAAQSFGARVHGKAVGTFGDVGIFSFGMYKNVTAFYGGIVVTNDGVLCKAIKSDLERLPYMSVGMLMGKAVKALVTDVVTSPALFKSIVYWVFRFGYLRDVHAINKFVTIELDTSRKTTLPPTYMRRFLPVQARMVLRQLPRVDEHAAVRIRYARLYHEGLCGLPGLILPPFRDDGSYVYNYFPIQYADRTALVRGVMQRCRDMAVQHLKNCASLPAFATEFRACPNAERTAAQVILLPNYPAYGEDSVRLNIAAIRSFLEDTRAVSDQDIEALAALHMSCLSDSDVTALGAHYARSFYRYVTRSSKELAVVERDGDGRVIAAVVVSLEPATLNRRLLLRTSLLTSALRRGAHLLARRASRHHRVSADGLDRTHVSSSIPEMLLVYTSPAQRGRGRATALIREAERRLRERCVPAYQIRTVDDPANESIGFYRRKGFTPSGTASKRGRRFQVFIRRLDEHRDSW